jgi:hypothetical protein
VVYFWVDQLRRQLSYMEQSNTIRFVLAWFKKSSFAFKVLPFGH